MSSCEDWTDLFKVTRYPSGEEHVELVKTPVPGSTLIANIRTFAELFMVVEADRILKHCNKDTNDWFIPFFPGARHDRRREAGDGLEVELAMELVRDMKITILDPHSDVTGRIKHIPQSEVVKAWKERGLFDHEACAVIPDYGATKKAMTWIMEQKCSWVQAKKFRNLTTGGLAGFDVETRDFDGQDCMIVDDLCDAGGTFLGLAEVLKERGAGRLYLAVTHGLFTKGIDELAKVFDQIYTTGPVQVEVGKKTPLFTMNYRTLFENSRKV